MLTGQNFWNTIKSMDKKARKHTIGVLPFTMRFAEVPARFVTFCFPQESKIKELPPSSWRQADVHRTSAFRSSNPPEPTKKETHQTVCFFLWRYRPDLNWRITVLQTGALPLGYGTNNMKYGTLSVPYFLERVTRLELATSTLARWRSTG